MIRSGWKGYSDSFDPWMGKFTNEYIQFERNPSNENVTDKTIVKSSVNGFAYGRENTTELQQQSVITNSQIFDSTAIPGDVDYKGDKYQGTINGILVPKI